MNNIVQEFPEPFKSHIYKKGLKEIAELHIHSVENNYKGSKSYGFEFLMINGTKKSILYNSKGEKIIYSEKSKEVAPIVSSNIDLNKPIYIVESETDYLILFHFTQNIICIPGVHSCHTISKYSEALYKLFGASNPIFHLVFDNDEAGRMGNVELIKEIFATFPHASLKTFDWSLVGLNIKDIRDAFNGNFLNFQSLEEHFNSIDEITLEIYSSQENIKLLAQSKEILKLPICFSNVLSTLIFSLSNSKVSLLIYLFKNKPILQTSEEFQKMNTKIQFVDSVPYPSLENYDYQVITDYFQGSFISSNQLFDEINSYYKKLIYFKDESYYELITLYTLLTYIYPIFEKIPYLHFCGIKGSGKSQAITAISNIAFNGENFTQPTLAAMKRSMNHSRGSFALDDMENFKTVNDNNTEMISMLNGGYDVNNTTRLIDASNGMKIVNLYIGGPKIIGSIGPLESTLASRFIRINMPLVIDTFHPVRIPSRNSLEVSQLRSKLLLWSLTSHLKIKDIFEVLFSKARATRENNLALPLLSLARFFDENYKTDLGSKIAIIINNSFTERSREETFESAMLKVLLRLSPNSGRSFKATSVTLCGELDYEEFGFTKFNIKSAMGAFLASHNLILDKGRDNHGNSKITFYEIDLEVLKELLNRYRLSPN